MVEVYDISNYLPINSGIKKVSDYSRHHLASLEKCVENELFSSAFFHLHMLYVLFIYCQLYRISCEFEKEFSYSLVGFPSNEKDMLSKDRNPFSFHPIHEKTVFRFFRLVGFDDGTIGNISGCVNMRNDHLHVNGDLQCATEEKMTEIVGEYERNMEQVVAKQKEFIIGIYTRIQTSAFPDKDAELTDQDVELNLITPGLFSMRDIDLIKAEGLKDHLSVFLTKSY